MKTLYASCTVGGSVHQRAVMLRMKEEKKKKEKEKEVDNEPLLTITGIIHGVLLYILL